MKAYISFCPFGVFAYDERGKLLEQIAFKRDVKSAVGSIQKCYSKQPGEEEKELVKKLNKYELVFDVEKSGYAYEFPNIATLALKENLLELAVKNKFVKTREELASFIFEVNFLISKIKVRESISDDKLVIQAINAIDEIEKSANLLSIRLREWYAFYFPELVDATSPNEKLVGLVSQQTSREKIEKIEVKETMGADLKKEDIEEMKHFAGAVELLFKEKLTLEKYIKLKVKEIMPNTSCLIDEIMAARLLAHAGSLQRLAEYPSSTIQVLGAEKALFRFLHGIGTPPKHGLLFQHAMINQAPKIKRGKIARVLASKLSLAVKIDYFKGQFIGNKLKEEFERRVKAI